MINEIAVNNFEEALELAEILIKNNYVVLLSREESLVIINYYYSHNSDRKNVVFMSVEEYEDELNKIYKEE